MNRLLRLLPGFACALTVLPAGLAAQAASNRAASRMPASHELPIKYTGPATRPAITAGDLMTRLYILADDSMMGRDAYSEGNVKGTTYIAGELARLGLEPAGEDGGFFQYPLVFDSTSSGLSTLSVNGSSFVLWHDFAPRDQGTGARAFDGAPVVYAGSLGDTAHMLPSSAVAGKVALLTLARDSAGNRNSNVNRFLITQRFHDASAIAVVMLDWVVPQQMQAFVARQNAVRSATPGPTTPSYFYVTKAAGTQLLGTDPEAATPGATGGTVHGDVKFGQTRAPGRNVVAILRGSDPALRNEYVAIGSHDDHIGFRTDRSFDHDSVRAFHMVAAPQGADNGPVAPTPEQVARIRAMTDSLHALHGVRMDSIYNGADDDGSGSVSLLEIAEQFSKAHTRPKRSMLFIWHAGEEYGMLGSRYFTDNPTVPRDSIVAELNIDMIGRGGATDITGVTKEGALIHGGPGYVQLIGSRRLSTELGNLAETVNTEKHLGLHFDYSLDANGHPQNIYCRSDHAMYARWGIPVVFFTTGGHADYHQLTDEPQYIDYDRMANVATMVYDLGERVANLDHRVVVDHPRPDPNGQCQQ
ncbi:MAG TPA: M28 family peptidase [Gemmatimonadales bacterium]